jgi:methionyl-tRNA formyltransferase
VEALEFLVERGDEVWAVVTKDDAGVDGWQRSLRAAALRTGVRVEQPRRIGEPVFVERLADFGANALVSIQYDQILRKDLFERIGCPCLNLHFALLPRHRGVDPMAWTILEGDATAGATLHWMVEEIDAGDVIAQRAVEVPPDLSARELYDRVSQAAIGLFRECYPFGNALLARRRPQDDAAACYHRKGDFEFSERRVDWRRPAPELQRWLRAMIFPPFQHPEVEHGGRLLLVTSVGGNVGTARGGAPGTVLARTGQAIEVAAGGGSLTLHGLVDPVRPGAPPEAVLAAIRVGDRLGGGDPPRGAA